MPRAVRLLRFHAGGLSCLVVNLDFTHYHPTIFPSGVMLSKRKLDPKFESHCLQNRIIESDSVARQSW